MENTKTIISSGFIVLNDVFVAAALYEKIRKLNPRQFAELYARNIVGEKTFDELVDELP